jgi:hypothetical protein
LALGEAFKKQGDTMKMQEVLEKILRIAPDSEISNLAQSLLTT